jgi:hypothetical protein
MRPALEDGARSPGALLFAGAFIVAAGPVPA